MIYDADELIDQPPMIHPSTPTVRRIVELEKECDRLAQEKWELAIVLRLYRDSHHYCVMGTPQGVCNKCRIADAALSKEPK